MAFRDDAESKAHEILCVIRYGSNGGSVPAKEVQQIGDIIRGHKLQPTIVIKPPLIKLPLIVIPPKLT